MEIACPVCKKPLHKEAGCYKCENRHSFDIAKEGYLNLNLRNSQNTGDNPEMIRARKNFLEKGYYDFLKDKVNELLNEEETLLDLACGEGYYTMDFKCKDKVGIDLSKSGLKIASKNDKGTLYILSSIFRCPLSDESVDKVITIFAPIAKDEIKRILKKDGTFILVKPDVRHLFELKQALYDEPYLNEVEDIPIEGMHIEKHIPVSDKALLSKEDLHNLFMMTPYYNTTSQNDKQKLEAIDELEVGFCFVIDLYRFDQQLSV
ncbi:MAG: methyltransferase domain-containing protein [Erysipelotrichaceae bacterium]|nr:methyltransferase domain-containing protein [Erysipelotrichaceae bacterium]